MYKYYLTDSDSNKPEFYRWGPMILFLALYSYVTFLGVFESGFESLSLAAFTSNEIILTLCLLFDPSMT